jgi:nucleoside phosphorylase
VTFALRQEGVSFERRLFQRVVKPGLVLGRLDAQEVVVYWLRLGVRNEDHFKRILTDLRPDLVINSGFAGAVRTLLEPGDFVLAENFSSPDLLSRLAGNSVFSARGRFLCVDTVADSAAKMQINSEGNIIALDMESSRVDAVCRTLSLPLISARMVSDRYDERIPAVFLGKGIRRVRDISEAIAFAIRMLGLRRRLAARLVELIRAVETAPLANPQGISETPANPPRAGKPD